MVQIHHEPTLRTQPDQFGVFVRQLTNIDRPRPSRKPSTYGVAGETTWGQRLFKGRYGAFGHEIGPKCRKACTRHSLTQYCEKPQLAHSTALSDIGCGSGMFCQMAAKLGAEVSGLDAAEPLLAIARERTPQGDSRAGEMEELPYADPDLRRGGRLGLRSSSRRSTRCTPLREARRVSRAGASVAIAVFGKRDDTEAAAYFAAVGSLLPPPPPGTPGPFARIG